MTEKLRSALDDTGKIVRKNWRAHGPKQYKDGAAFGRRDALPVAAVLVLCVGVYVAHDVFAVIPLPSEETVSFLLFVGGLYYGRKFTR